MPPKRRRLTSAQPAKKTTKRVINQSIHPSINQSNSLFCQLPSAVFIIICHFLDLDCKCRTLSLLCHDVRAMFKPETCCLEVKIEMKSHLEKVLTKKNSDKHSRSKLVMDCDFPRCVGRSGYMKYATSISARYQGIQSINKADRVFLIDALREGINSGNLTSLDLHEVLVSDSGSSHVVKPALKCLAELTSEQTTNFHDLNASVVNKQRSHLWTGSDASALLSNPDFLPHLKRFSNGRYFDALATIMNATGCPRPIEYIVAPAKFTNATFSWCWNVRHLELRIPNTSILEMLNNLSALDDHVLPSLRELTVMIHLHRIKVDLSRLLTFISKRPIERLLGEITDGTYGSNLASPAADCITVSVMHDLGRLRTIRQLNLEFMMSFPLFEQLSVVPADSWPQLETLYAGRLSPDNVTLLLQAAPRLKRLSASINLVSLAEVAHCGTDIMVRDNEKVTLTELQAAFAAFGVTGFPELTKLTFDNRSADDVMHYLITKLSTARELRIVSQTVAASFLQLHLCAKLCSMIGRPKLLRCTLPSEVPKDLSNYSFKPWYDDASLVDQVYALAASRLSEAEILAVQKWDSGDYSILEGDLTSASTV